MLNQLLVLVQAVYQEILAIVLFWIVFCFDNFALTDDLFAVALQILSVNNKLYEKLVLLLPSR